MDTFQKSRDGKWYYGGYVTVDPEEYTILNRLAKEWEVPERIAAGILLRRTLREIMGYMDYVDGYKEKMAHYKESIKEEVKDG